MKLSYREFKAIWSAMTWAEQETVRAKTKWEHMTLWAVLMDWSSFIPERLRSECNEKAEGDG